MFWLLMSGIAASLLGWVALRSLRLRRSLRNDDDSACAACGSTALDSLGPSAYRCSRCEYEGGSGLRELRRSRERARLAALTPEERMIEIERAMGDARLLLVNARGFIAKWEGVDLGAAALLVPLIARGAVMHAVKEDSRSDREHDDAAALSQLREAWLHLEKVAALRAIDGGEARAQPLDARSLELLSGEGAERWTRQPNAEELGRLLLALERAAEMDGPEPIIGAPDSTSAGRPFQLNR